MTKEARMRGALVLIAVMGAMLLGGCPDREVTPPDGGPDLLIRDFPHPGELRRDGGAPPGDRQRSDGSIKPNDGPKPAFDWPWPVDWPVAPPPGPTLNVDLLFLVDSSNSMEEEQKNLVAQFPKLLQALRSPKLGQANPGGPPCTAADTSNCRIPNVHIGVIDADLGAGNFSFSTCEVPGGSGGKLQTTAKLAPPGCPKPTEPWISYTNGVTNVPTGNVDAILRVQESFACIAPLGVGGCGFEQQLESVRRALTPGVNPGFLRADSMLVVVMITDEDDCSAMNTSLYDPTQQGLGDPLGPLTSFRCFEFGVTCDQANLRQPGPKTNCKPGKSWLYPPTGYVNFLKGLRPPQRLLVAAVAGPVSPVEVGLDGVNPTLKASCSSINGHGVPGLRMKSVIDGLGTSGVYNTGVIGGQAVPVSICSPDFGPMLQLVGQKIAAAL